MLAVDAIARRYGVLPSKVLGVSRARHPFRALCVDLWAHNWSVQRGK